MRTLPAAAVRRVLLPLAALALSACAAPAPAPTSPSASLDPTACGPPPPAAPSGWPQASAEIVPIIVSSERAVGRNRFLLSLADSENELIASPDLPVTLSFFDLTTAPDRPSSAAQDASFLWSVEGEAGLYRASVDFPCSGPWGAEVTALPEGGSPQTARVVFDVLPAGSTPPLEAPAPAAVTPTAADAATAARTISTDDDPDPDFYRQSLDQALEGDEPVVLVFATPAFCATRVCGPTLDIAKDVAADYKDTASFVHAEPYELHLVDGALQPVLDANGVPQLTEAARAYGLPVEPYVFVIDADDRVAAKFEGVAGEDELRAALDEVTSGG